MDEFDPIPPVDRRFKGVAVALIVMAAFFCLIGIAASAITLTMLVLS